MIIANSALRALLAIYHLISNARSWNNNIVNYTQCINHLVSNAHSQSNNIVIYFYQLEECFTYQFQQGVTLRVSDYKA